MGVYLPNPVKEKNHKKGESSTLAFVSAEMQGWRKNMEDAVVHQLDIGDGNGLFAVFDGHGGFEVSNLVSKFFIPQLTKLQSYKSALYEKALQEAFQNVDEFIKSPEGQKQLRAIRYKGETPTVPLQEAIGGSVGCTANVVLITPDSYYVANAGDSRSVLSRGGKAIALSEDHKPESPGEEARIIKAGGKVSMGRVNGGLNLTRSFGDFDYKTNESLRYDQQMITCKPDVRKFDRQAEDDFILIGCDGIWQRYVQNNQGIINIVHEWWKKGIDHQKILQDLLETIIATDTSSGIGCDNMSVILVTPKK